MIAEIKRLAYALVVSMTASLVCPALAGAASPCEGSLDYLAQAYKADRKVRRAYDLIYDGLQDPPQGYNYAPTRNPWKAAGSGKGLYLSMRDMFQTWCKALPEIDGTADNALDGIEYFAWFYYKNPPAKHFIHGRDPANPAEALDVGPRFLKRFTQEIRRYMDSKESARIVPSWVADPRIEIQDYRLTDPHDYRSWNAFFARELKQAPDGTYPSRPVTMPERDYVVVSPTDCIMNPLVQALSTKKPVRRRFVENPLRLNTVLDVKNSPLRVSDLLAGAPDSLKRKFDGGTGLACVLMPNTYHHFHSPVDGTVVYKELVKTGSAHAVGTFGYDDWPNWVPLDGNVGGAGTDYSQFQVFQRGVVIVEVKYRNVPGRKPAMLTGYVASVPVGLDTVGSVVLNDAVQVGSKVRKGVTRFGNFLFGGSLDILLFSKGMIKPRVQTRMGNQIAVIDVGQAPPSPWTRPE